MDVAHTIAAQIGNRAFMMMGAKNLAAGESTLTWKIGRNAKGVTHVRVELTPMDTYTVRFYRVRGTRQAELEAVDDVYVDSLRSTIENHTGLYLSL